MKIIKTSDFGSTPWDKTPSSKTTKKHHDAVINRDGGIIDVSVTYDFEPGEKPTLHSPAFPPFVDIYKTVDRAGSPVEITDQEEEEIKKEIIHNLALEHHDHQDDF